MVGGGGGSEAFSLCGVLAVFDAGEGHGGSGQWVVPVLGIVYGV